MYAKSPNSYMDEELFITWFTKRFVPETNHIDPRILIIAGHRSHINLDVMENNVELY